MKIAIARLRSRIIYTEPLKYIIDPFFECLREFMRAHPEHEYLFYNCSFGGKAKRDIDAIRQADVVLIPTENEFHAWVPNYLHPLNLAKTNEHIEAIKPHLNGKRVILLTHDRGDTPELFRQYTFAGCTPESILEIDEDDFSHGIAALKYYFIKDHIEKNAILPTERTYDFIYWGTEKRKLAGGAISGDERHLVLKEISKSKILTSHWVGRFSNIKRDAPLMSMSELIPRLVQSRMTLCFNWLDTTAITARYHEAMATGIVPYVWRDYDRTNRLGILPWQRKYEIEEVVGNLEADKVLNGKLPGWGLLSDFDEAHESYIANLPTRQSIVDRFGELLELKLKQSV